MLSLHPNALATTSRRRRSILLLQLSKSLYRFFERCKRPPNDVTKFVNDEKLPRRLDVPLCINASDLQDVICH